MTIENDSNVFNEHSVSICLRYSDPLSVIELQWTVIISEQHGMWRHKITKDACTAHEFLSLCNPHWVRLHSMTTESWELFNVNKEVSWQEIHLIKFQSYIFLPHQLSLIRDHSKCYGVINTYSIYFYISMSIPKKGNENVKTA